MKLNPKASSQEVLAGLVEWVTLHNEDNGFCLLRTRARGHRDLVTVVGQAAAISAGEWLTASGEWSMSEPVDSSSGRILCSPPTRFKHAVGLMRVILGDESETRRRRSSGGG
jgi:hypothetical protein